MKISNDTIGSSTFRFVAQCLNHCVTACPQIMKIVIEIFYVAYVSVAVKVISKTEANQHQET
jgi:hypothetical protein